MKRYATPAITVAGSLRSLTLAGDGGGLEVGSLLFPPFPQDPVTTT